MDVLSAKKLGSAISKLKLVAVVIKQYGLLSN